MYNIYIEEKRKKEEEKKQKEEKLLFNYKSKFKSKKKLIFIYGKI